MLPTATLPTSNRIIQHDVIGTAILKALVYYDLFNHPLTLVEIWQSLPKVRATLEEIDVALDGLVASGKVVTDRGFYALLRREAIIDERLRRQKIAIFHWKALKHAMNAIRHIPFIRMIGVVNSLALENVTETSDIDLLFVVKKRRLYLTRALLYLLLWLRGEKISRTRTGRRLCLSFLITEDALDLKRFTLADLPFEKDVHRIFWFRELLPIFGKEVYQKFLAANPWIHEEFPNFVSEAVISGFEKLNPSRVARVGERMLRGPVGNLFESIAARYQKRIYAKLTQGSPAGEVQLTFSCIKLHTQDRRREIAREYQERCRTL
ncbi:MAG: hypothetical protein HY459_00915 [Parcubacteria group bacterium]|nr:hypothetical protein [Parcubacteria group bacterium]